MQRCTLAFVLGSAAMWAADTGVPPRPKSTDYPVRLTAKAATIAGAVVPSDQVAKLFSTDIAKQYIVVEVAIYPVASRAFDIEIRDFTLRVGNQSSFADRPTDVAPWPQRRVPDRETEITTQAGIAYEQTKDPVYGKRQAIGTYAGVSVADEPAHGPSPPFGPDPQVLASRIEHRSLPEGQTRLAVAGYLYFARSPKTGKKDPLELTYSKDDETVSLAFPKETRR
jgi:hypothetical protein